MLALGPLLFAALLPLLAVTATAFAKVAVLLGLLRGGLGLPSALPAPVIWGFAAVLAAAVMAPVGAQIDAAVTVEVDDPRWPVELVERGWPILDAFLVAHTDPEDAAAIDEALRPLAADDAPRAPARIVAFLVSELGAAFRLGVLLLAPFLVIDLLCAQVLAAVGFGRLPPSAVALPFKLLLFVVADGWLLLVRGVAGSYG